MISITLFISLSTSATEKQLEELCSKLDETIAQLEEAIRLRKDLEEITEHCQHWFKQADINLAVEIRHSTSPEILVEHIVVVRVAFLK